MSQGAGPGGLSGGAVARCFVYGLAVALVAGSVAAAFRPLGLGDGSHVSWFVATAAAAVGLALLAARKLAASGWRPGRGLRALDLVALNALLALGLAEVALRAAQWAAPSSLLWDDSSAARTVVDRRRCEPGTWFRYRCNRLGYPDEDFEPAGPDDYTVALIGDSFGVGSVPWSHLFATLAEEELRARLGARHARVAIDNRSLIGLDLLAYRYLYEREVRGGGYRQVVLCFFVGNDMERTSERGRWQRLLQVQGWLPVELGRRLWLVAQGVERERGPREAALTDAPPFLADPALEPPYFTPAAYLRIEASRALVSAAGVLYVEEQYRDALRELDAWHAELGARLLLLVIPDEFQVNDALWEVARAASARTYDLPPQLYRRDYPQERIARWAEPRGARVLDLLPALREAERAGRTYHLRDTHWNAHGNRVAGRELARALAEGEDAAH
jgi:hypothetical protein